MNDPSFFSSRHLKSLYEMDLMISLETTAVNTVCSSVSMEHLLNTKKINNVLIIEQTMELARNTTLIHYH